MEFLNKFIKGAITDVDYLLRDGTVWTFPTINARAFNLEGQGFVVTNVGGNELAFKVSTHFAIIGACEYNGILYIVSRKLGYADCEIGCYPSPRQWSASNTDFDDSVNTGYKPLFNYKPAGTITDFRTSLFNFDLKRLEVIPRLDYDNTVNLYICDDKNPNYVVNTGFKQNGNWVGDSRYYTTEYFNGAINLIPSTSESESIDVIEWANVEYGGRLRPGVYYIFLRLLTDDYARTKFMSYCGPIPINEGDSMIYSQGLPDKNIVTNTEPYTVKRINLNINIPSTAYKFFELAVLRYSSDYDYGKAKPNVTLIARQYPINTTTVSITGLEAMESLTIEELFSPQFPYNICKTELQISNAYLGGNWKRKEINYDALKEYARLIKAYGYLDIDNPVVEDHRIYDIETGAASQPLGYKKPDNYNRVGYFRGEIYPVGIVFMFDDNTESQVYPVSGLMNGSYNDKGLVRMPTWFDCDEKFWNCPLSIRFDNSAAFAYYADPDNTALFERVIGFRYVRGERIDNLICQGYTLPVYDHIYTTYKETSETHEWGFSFEDSTEGYSTSNSYCIPLIEGLLPTALYDTVNQPAEEEAYHYSTCIDDESILYTQEGEDYWRYYTESANSQDRTNHTKRYRIYTDGKLTKIKFGLFSPDINFNENPYIPVDVYMGLVRRGFPYYVDKNNKHSFYTLEYDIDTEAIVPKFIGMDLLRSDTKENHNLVDAIERPVKQIEAKFIEAFTQKGEDMFTSWLPAEAGKFHKTTPSEAELDEMYNRSYRTSRYIGLTDTRDWPSRSLFDYKYHIVNLYKQDPDDLVDSILDTYQLFGSEYRLVNNKMMKLSAVEILTCFQGDCFLQKSFIRVGRWYGFEKPGVKELLQKMGIDGEGYMDTNGNYYQWGIYLGVITENKYNVDLRNDVYTRNEDQQPFTYTYLPRAIRHYDNVKNWVVYRNDAAQEAMQINDGYNQTLFNKIYLGYDPNRDYSNELLRPNRVYFSSKDTAGSIVDGYRIIGLQSYKDYNTAGGEIVKMCNIEDFLCIVQKHNIIQIAVDEKMLETASNISQLVLGTSMEFLSKDFKLLANYGSQHQFSILTTDTSVYGIDFIRRIIWQTAPQRSSTGRQYLESVDMGIKYNFKSEIENIFDQFYSMVQPVTGMEDDTINNKGCFVGYDRKYKEVLFCFALPGDRASFYVLVFSELIQGFTSRYTFRTNMLMSLLDDLYSVGLDYQNSMQPTNYIYKHNQGTPQTFYGESAAMSISFVVTGLTEQENVSNFRKIFEALAIDMNDVQLTSIAYETQYQLSAYTFSVDSAEADRYKDAEYLEHTWQVPVLIQTSAVDNDFSADSEMRGRWMKVTLTYYPATTPQEIFIRSVITKFTLSVS